MSLKKLFLIFIAVALAVFIYRETRPPVNPPDTVPQVDLSRYLGAWYEIASIPFFWSKGCICSNANYSLRSDGDIKVVNSCVKDGKWDAYTGRAWTVDSTNSKLKVEFFWPFSGDYWIVALEANYQWVVVSNPYRDYLWILSRTKTLEANVYDGIIAFLKAKDFPIDQLHVTPQNC